jgi:hypothetical protein
LGGIKVERPWELNEDHIEWLKKMAAKYDLTDEHKAMRIVLDHAIMEGDEETIFNEVRCNHC